MQNKFRIENGGIGYLNFNMILHRLKTKKYGPGKNMIKEEVLKHHITNVFRNCEKYYLNDALSMRLSKILEIHYQQELKNSINIKFQPFRSGSNKKN
jgi:signal transduction histidine kinase